jgi:hypothetical protein
MPRVLALSIGALGGLIRVAVVGLDFRESWAWEPAREGGLGG